MKTTKFTEQQIVFALQQAENGVKVAEVCPKMGIHEATFYNWKKKYGGLEVSASPKIWPVKSEVLASTIQRIYTSGKHPVDGSDVGVFNHHNHAWIPR